MTPQRLFTCGLVVAFLSFGADADASGDLLRYPSTPTPEGVLGAMAAQPLYPTELTASATLQYVRHPLVWRYADGSYEPAVRHQGIVDLAFGIGVLRLVDVGVVLPLVLTQRGENSAELGDLSGAGRGDLRVIPRVYLVPERSFGWGLALVPEVTLPTGNADLLIGEEGAAFRPKVVATLPWGPVRGVANLGYRLRKNSTLAGVTLADEIESRLGVDLNLEGFGVPATALAELATSFAAAHPLTGKGLLSAEVLGGARTRVMGDWLMTAGLGAGLSRGLGTPAVRVLLGVAYAPVPIDTDGDGIADLGDDCPSEPEDYDQFADIDGCPDLDNDGDEIPDRDDKCPLVPEERTEEADGDGCPGGSPLDSDGDGLVDRDDECPNLPEDFDGVEDDDGCPDNDHDHDGVPNDRDLCPKEKETINGVDDADGCPDAGEAKTEYVPETRIDIRETVLFETGKSTIKAESIPLLAQVALQILAHPEIRKIRIEGHTDDRGPEDDNLYLSQDRADAVKRYLVTQGVAQEILEAQGFGETMPIDSNNTAAGRAHNRRVEFVIVETRSPHPAANP